MKDRNRIKALTTQPLIIVDEAQKGHPRLISDGQGQSLSSSACAVNENAASSAFKCTLVYDIKKEIPAQDSTCTEK